MNTLCRLLDVQDACSATTTQACFPFGSCGGKVVYDTITFAGITVAQQGFGTITSESGYTGVSRLLSCGDGFAVLTPLSRKPASGIFGFAFPAGYQRYVYPMGEIDANIVYPCAQGRASGYSMVLQSGKLGCASCEAFCHLPCAWWRNRLRDVCRNYRRYQVHRR